MKKPAFDKIISDLYLKRDPKSNKSDYGRALLIGGSAEYPGAILIAASFAALSGDGYNALAVPSSIYPVVASRVPLTFVYENFFTFEDGFPIPGNEEKLAECCKRYSSILIGNGLKDCERNYLFLAKIIEEYEGILVIDATGLALLAEYGIEVLARKQKNSTIILTPHSGEAAKLFGVKLLKRDPSAYRTLATAFAKKHQVYILLKSYKSILVEPDGKATSSSYGPTPSLAKAGSGDGLAGYLTGLLAYGTKKETASEVIFFADEMIHRSAKTAEEKKSPGLASILSAKGEIENIIKRP
jgi:ADP-dependent NAD(P)H-hydrate dehydratase / NAD(P)H-hydrate epimerase